jgi:hypothetical protein
VPGYLGKLLFPNASRGQRRRRMRNVWFWLVVGVLIVGVVAGLIYVLYKQGQMLTGASGAGSPV